MAKRTEALVNEAKRLKAEGRSLREIAEILSSSGVKVTAGTVKNWTDEADVSSLTSAEPRAPAPAAITAAPATPAEPVSDDPMSPEEFASWLAKQLRAAQEESDACRVLQDRPGQARAMRLAAQLANLLQKVQARAGEDGETVRVKSSDMAAAAERARSKLHDLVSRLSGERSRGPA